MVDINVRPEVASDVIFPTEGGIWFAPIDATVEYGALAALPTGSVFAGIISEDGVTETIDQSTTIHRGWQGGRAYRTTVDDGTTTAQFVFMETNEFNRSIYLAAKKNSTTGGFHFNVAKLGDHFQVFIVGIDVETGRTVKRWYPDAQVTARGDRTTNSTDGSGLDVTITGYAKLIEGETTNFVEWIDDGTSGS